MALHRFAAQIADLAATVGVRTLEVLRTASCVFHSGFIAEHNYQ